LKYQALYRKYRPSKFEDVVGQDIVIKTLKNSLKTGKISHAYMFSGPRGTGKTSIAKLLAKTINCLDIEDGDSCNICRNCKSILSNECTDIIEIDAASNNGVDEIREIKNKITLVPNELKYKVYIIDEVHMLSIGAFNALLKTLEEPPSHVIFILATTDLHKVPVTIISRCQCFEFKRITDNDIVSRLEKICEAEKVSIDSKILNRIAVYSEGGLRDAIGLLDKLISYASDNITMEDLNEICGLLSYDYHEKFLNLVFCEESLEILNEIDKIYNQGKDFIIFTQELMILIKKKLIDSLKNNLDKEIIAKYLKLLSSFNDMIIKLKQTDNVRVVFEIGIISLFYNKNDIKNISREINFNNSNENKEKSIENTKELSKSSKNPFVVSDDICKSEDCEKMKLDYTKLKKIYINNTFVSASKDKKNAVLSKWHEFKEYVLDVDYGAAACYLVDSTVEAVGDNHMILSVRYDSSINRILENYTKIDDLLKKIFNKSYKIAFLTNDEWKHEKNNYIISKNSIEYKYMDDSLDNYNSLDIDNIDDFSKDNYSNEKENDFHDNIVSEAINIFGKNIVEIK